MDATTSETLRREARGGHARRERRRLKLRYGLIALGAVVLIVGGIESWLSGGRYIYTDDAYVQANVLNVSTDVSGLVDQIMVRESEQVKQVASQQAQVDADQATYQRYASLVARNDVTRQQYDDARYKLAADQALLEARRAAAQSALVRLGGNADLPVEAMPAYKAAAAQLGNAQRDYRHSLVRAPFDGIVTQVSKLQPGQFLAAGTPASSPFARWWRR